MWLTAEDRRRMLNLYNVSEAARAIGVSVHMLHYQLKVGRLPKPQRKCGKRPYYHGDDLPNLEKQWEAIQNRP